MNIGFLKWSFFCIFVWIWEFLVKILKPKICVPTLFSSIMPKRFWLSIILYIQQFSLSKSFFCKNSKLLTSSFASGLRPFLVRNWRFLAIIKNFWRLTICDVKFCLWIEADICVYKMCTKTSVQRGHRSFALKVTYNMFPRM